MTSAHRTEALVDCARLRGVDRMAVRMCQLDVVETAHPAIGLQQSSEAVGILHLHLCPDGPHPLRPVALTMLIEQLIASSKPASSRSTLSSASLESMR